MALKIDGRSCSPKVLEKAMICVARNPGYNLAAATLGDVGDISITGRHLRNLAVQIGGELESQRDAKTEAYFSQPCYVNGSPIGNSRIVEVTRDHGTFTFKDYRGGGELRTETVSGEEFVWRFLIHILPPRFRRVRHRGFLANPVRTERIARIRAALGVTAVPEPPTAENTDGTTSTDDNDQLKAPSCPHCGAEAMIWQSELLPAVDWVAVRYGHFGRRAGGAGLGAPAAWPP